MAGPTIGLIVAEVNGSALACEHVMPFTPQAIGPVTVGFGTEAEVAIGKTNSSEISKALRRDNCLFNWSRYLFMSPAFRGCYALFNILYIPDENSMFGS